MWKNVRMHFRTYWKLVYLLEGVWRVLTTAQLVGRVRERVLPCSLEKLEKSDWPWKKMPLLCHWVRFSIQNVTLYMRKNSKIFPCGGLLFILFIKVPRFFEISSVLKNFWLHACLLEKKWGDNRRKRFYSKMWGSTVWRGFGRGRGEDCVKIPCDFPYLTFLWKLLNTFRWVFGAC